MRRVLRIATVGLGVTLACVVAGALAGTLCVAITMLIGAGPRAVFSDVGFYGVAGLIGGICGLVVGPLAAFGFLRRVPLGRLFAETALGAMLGGLVGLPLMRDFAAILAVAVAGFAVAVGHLAWRYRAPRAPADRALAGGK